MEALLPLNASLSDMFMIISAPSPAPSPFNLTPLSTPTPLSTADPPVPSNAATLDTVRYVVQKVLVPVVVVVGVMGNMVNMAVLTRRAMVNSTNVYLTALAACDTLYLLTSLSLSLQHYPGFRRHAVYVHWYPYGRVLSDMAANVSVLLTVTFTLERWVGVCHPMKGRTLCTPHRARILSATVAFLAVACTFPELFELEVVWTTVVDRGGVNRTFPQWQYTALSATPSYQLGYYWFYVTFFTFLPLLLLCVFNGILIHSLLKAAQLRHHMTFTSSLSGSGSGSCVQRRGRRGPGGGGGGRSERQWREQQWITKMLVTVVLAFILCQLPGAVLTLLVAHLHLSSTRLTAADRNQLRMAGNVTNLLLQINAAINLALYSLTSSKFRRVLRQTLGCGRVKESRSLTSISTSHPLPQNLPLISLVLSGSGSVRSKGSNTSLRMTDRRPPHFRLFSKSSSLHLRKKDSGNPPDVWNGHSEDGFSPATDVCYTDSEKEL